MKKSLKILILFLCVFIQSKAAFAAKKTVSEDFDKPTEMLSGSPISLVNIKKSPMQYSFFDDGNSKKIKIQQQVGIPVYGEDSEYVFIDEIIGIWDANDPYVRETFEFIDDHLCRYRQ